MHALETTPGRTCVINGTEFLFFSGYSYLGMNHVKEFRDLVNEGIERYGILFPSSRVSNTALTLFENFEHELSLYTGMQNTVIFSSGTLAGRTAAGIVSPGKKILVAPGAHPSIRPEPQAELSNESFTGWSQKVVDVINSAPDEECIVVTDAVNVLTGELHDFSFLLKIDEHKKPVILIDISHGAGLPLANGKDIIHLLPRAGNLEYIMSYSLSKAFNIPGGAISCGAAYADKIRRHPNYTGSTSVPPALIHAFLNGKDLYRVQRDKLAGTVAYCKAQRPSPGVLKNDFNLPVFICNKENAEAYFYGHRIIISSFSYPYPSSPKTNRVVLSALHSREDIDCLLEAL